ncbi:MAG: DUF4838 domain-containing protein [Kiritimatiellae bacterium]|nr:DUF4838 domain-containing protein [Kiritimatiellia bacterium]
MPCGDKILLVLLLVLLLAGGWQAGAAAAGLTLVQDGQPKAGIVLAKSPTRATQFAADELQWHIARITGVKLPFVTDDVAPTPGQIRLCVGESAATVALGLKNADLKSQEYLVKFTPDAVVLMGRDKEDRGKVVYDGEGAERSWPPYLDEQGTCYAVYDLLEKGCGVRWFWPTEIGLDCPVTKTLTVVGADVRRAFDYRYRIGFGDVMNFPDPLWAAGTVTPAKIGNWGLLNSRETHLFWHRWRLGGEQFSANHTFNHWGHYYETHPDWYGFGYPKGSYAQPCMSNPEVVAQIVKEAREYFDKGVVPYGVAACGDFYPVVPNDSGAWCKCAKCQAKLKKDDSGQFSNASASELVFTFVNEIAKQVRQSHPQKFIATLAYAQYAYPPTSIQVESNVAVMTCLHVRNWWSPAIAQNDLKFFDAWATQNRPLYLWLYDCFPQMIAKDSGYYAFPAFQPHTFDRQFKHFRACGARGAFLNGFTWCQYQGDFRYRVWGEEVVSVMEQLDHYVMFKLFDDSSQDVDRLMDDFFTRYYGSAAAPMKELYRQLEDTYSNPASYPPDNLTGKIYGHQNEELAWKWLGTEVRMKAWGTLMEAATQAANTPKTQARVELFRKGVWDYLVAGRADYLRKQDQTKKYAPGELWLAPQPASRQGDAARVDWTQAAAIEVWRYPNGTLSPRRQNVRATHDGEWLYLRFEEAGDPRKLVQGREPESGDRWEFIFRLYSGSFRRIVFSSDGGFQTFVSGEKQDGREVYSWESGARVLSDTRATDQWILTAALPLARLWPGGIKPGWWIKANFIRATTDGDYSLWLPMPKGFADLDGVGRLGLE